MKANPVSTPAALAWAREYGRAYYKKHRERILARNQVWRKANPGKNQAAQRLRDRERRQRTIAKYGGICVCCGESRYEFLQFDHIHGGGYQHRKKVGNGTAFVVWLEKTGYPEIVQLLCANCNYAKAFYKACPHVVH